MFKECLHCKLSKPIMHFNKCPNSLKYRPECKQCKSIYEKQNRLKNKMQIAIAKTLWRKNNKDKVTESRIRSKSYRQTYYQKNKEKSRINNSEWYRKHPHIVAAKSAKYNAQKLQATPKWLTKDQFKEIEEFYLLAKELQWLSDSTDPLEVDHIIPLRGKNVSGLHVPWNLQILPGSLNRSKGNKS